MKLTAVAVILAVFVLCEVSEPAEGTRIIAKIKETWQNIKGYFHRHNATVPCDSAEEDSRDPEVIPEEQIDPRFGADLSNEKSIKKRQTLYETYN